MENHVLPQLQLLLLSALLGAAGAAVYDLLRAIRLQRRRDRLLTHLLDGVYVALAALALAAFGLRLGGGELRLYTLLHAALGAVLYFLLAAPLLRPLWAFWTDAAAELLRLLWLPASLLGRLAKKILKKAKKDFHFLRRYATIKRYRWEIVLVRRSAVGKGGRVRREKSKKGKKDKARPRLHHRSGAGGADRRGGHRAGAAVGQAEGRPG